MSAIESSHPLVHVMTHPASDTYALTSLPNVIADWADCATRSRDEAIPDDIPLDYGEAFGMNLRFRMLGGEAPIFRTLWVQENGSWKIVSYDIEDP